MTSDRASAELPLRQAYPFAARRGLIDQVEYIRKARPPAAVHESVFRRALIADALLMHGLLDEFVRECWSTGATPEGRARLARYGAVLSRRSPGEAHRAAAAPPSAPTLPRKPS